MSHVTFIHNLEVRYDGDAKVTRPDNVRTCLTAETFFYFSIFEKCKTNVGKKLRTPELSASTMKTLLFKIYKDCTAWVKAF